jgi:hypothetical protein
MACLHLFGASLPLPMEDRIRNAQTGIPQRVFGKGLAHINLTPPAPSPLVAQGRVGRSKTVQRGGGEGEKRLLRGCQLQLSNFPKTLSERIWKG